MIIETRHNVGDEVFFMFQNKIAIGSVSAFYFNSGAMDGDDLKALNVTDYRALGSKLGITYKIAINSERELYIPEHQLFKSRQEVIESL